ncbi:MAG: hypothetical protein OEX07_01080 [Gammaproteobacteria bacterium]|nr:hypothetical protein [Gammaproteobacteria bacterium]
MVTQNAIHKITDLDDEYFGDIFTDERYLIEDLDPDDLLTDAMPANQEIWDVISISDEEWIDAQPDGFFMP